MEDENEIFVLLHNIIEHDAHMAALTAQSVFLNGAMELLHSDSESSESKDEGEGPGRGNTADGQLKATYARRHSSSIYHRIREEDPNIQLFDKTVHLTREEFDDLHNLVKDELSKPINVRHSFTDAANATRQSRKRRLDTDEMLFFILDILNGANEGGLGVENVGLKYGISPATVSNYIRHSLFAIYKVLDGIDPPLIRWPDEVEREEMTGLIVGCPKCVFFIDGNKNKRWRPKDRHEQERAYDGYKHTHAFAIVAFCDIYGRFIRLEITDHGAESDRNLYTNSDVYMNPSRYLSPGQHGMADMGFGGDGELVVPFKSHGSTEWMYRVEYNQSIRGQRMVNEWGLGYVNKRFRLFLGRWPFEPDLFIPAYKMAAMLCNWRFERRGYALQTKERYLQKLEAAEKSDSD